MSKLNRVVFVGGGKGGVGKSTVTQGLVDALLRTSHKVIVVESDDSNPDTYKALHEVAQCEICNLDNEDGYIKLGGIIENNPEAVVVIDTAARATDNIVKHIGIVSDVATEQKRVLAMLWPINRQRSSLELLKTLLDATASFEQVYVVKNTYYGAPEKFSRYDNSKLKTRVTGTINFPELNDLLCDKLNDDRLALSNADAGLSIAERSVLRRYRDAVQEAIRVIYE